MVDNNTFISDGVKLIRDLLDTNMTDPLSRGTRWVYTSYPQENVVYPILTVRNEGTPGIRRMGARSSLHLLNINVEVRVWARNEKEKDTLNEEMINLFRNNQFSGSKLSDTERLHDWNQISSVPVDETGREGIKSQVNVMNFVFILGGTN